MAVPPPRAQRPRHDEPRSRGDAPPLPSALARALGVPVSTVVRGLRRLERVSAVELQRGGYGDPRSTPPEPATLPPSPPVPLPPWYTSPDFRRGR